MNRISISELRSKLKVSEKHWNERIEARDMTGSTMAEIRTKALEKEIRKRKLELELELC